MSGSETEYRWRPATLKAVTDIVNAELNACSPEEIVAFRLYAVEPFSACLVRHGKKEAAMVVARKQDEVIYWEDVEEGFNISPISEKGIILEHYCNQDTIGQAIRHWL